MLSMSAPMIGASLRVVNVTWGRSAATSLSSRSTSLMLREKALVDRLGADASVTIDG